MDAEIFAGVDCRSARAQLNEGRGCGDAAVLMTLTSNDAGAVTCCDDVPVCNDALLALLTPGDPQSLTEDGLFCSGVFLPYHCEVQHSNTQ